MLLVCLFKKKSWQKILTKKGFQVGCYLNWVSELKVFYASEKNRVRSPSPHAEQARCVLFIYIVCQGMILLNELLLEKMRVVSNFVCQYMFFH